MIQNRWKSKVALAAIGAQAVSLLIALGVMDTGMGEVVNGVIMAVLELLVAFGVLNNPTDSGHF